MCDHIQDDHFQAEDEILFAQVALKMKHDYHVSPYIRRYEWSSNFSF